MRSRAGAEWAGWIAAAGLAWLVLLPLGFVALEAVRGTHGPTFEAIGRFAAGAHEWRAVTNSLVVSLLTVVGSALLGIPLAVAAARVEFSGRRIAATLLALPAVLPPLVGVIGFLFLYGETGFVARAVQTGFGLDEAPWKLEGLAAIVLVHVSTMYVYFYLFTRAGLAGIDRSVYEAAESLGARPWRVFRTVTLPLLRSHLAGAALLVLMTSLASFSAPYLFGGSYRVMTTQIMATKLNGDDRLAMVETLSLTLLALIGLAALRRAEGRRSFAGGSKGTPPVPKRIGRGQTIVPLAVWLLAIWLVLPHIALLLVSFVPRGTWTIETLPPVLSVTNYRTLIADPIRLRPILASGWMALVATAGAVAIGVAVGVLAVARRVRVGPFLEAVLALPWAVPGTVFAIALATAFSVNAPLTGRILLVGTVAILPLAYLVRSLPLTGRAILAGFRQLDPSLEEAAESLGASRWRVLRRITVPLLRPAIVAAATLSFVTALGDFVTSILLYTYDTRPISLEILASLRQADVGVAAAYGVLLMVASAAVFYAGGEGRSTG